MQTEHNDTITAGPEAPEDQARDVVEAMSTAIPVKPEVERAILGAGRAHARFLERIGGEERPE